MFHVRFGDWKINCNFQDLKFWPASIKIDSSHSSSTSFLPLAYTTDYTQSYQSSSAAADIASKSTKKQRIKKKHHHHSSSRQTQKEDPLLDQRNKTNNNNKWLENRANQSSLTSSYVKLLNKVSTFDAFKEVDGINTPGLGSQSQQYRDLDCRYQK